MSSTRVLRSAPARYILSMLVGFIATVLLFLAMVVLIHFSYMGKAQPKIDLVDALIEKPVEKDESNSALAKLQSETQKLKEPIVLPPSVATKTSVRSPLPPSKTAVQIRFAPSFESFETLDFDIKLAPSFAAGAARSGLGNRGSGQKKGFGDTDDIGGERQCTIMFEVGGTASDIAEFQWIDCLNGQIVDETEAALYEWVQSGSQSYKRLNPQPGDSIEFTYEQKG